MTPAQVAHIMALVDAAAPFVKLFQQADASRDQPMDGRSNINAQIAVKDLRRLVYAADEARAAIEAALSDAPQQAEPTAAKLADALEAFNAAEFDTNISRMRAAWRALSTEPKTVGHRLEGLPEALREAASHLSAIMGEEIAEARMIRHFLPDELEGFALMVEDISATPSAPTAVEPDERAMANELIKVAAWLLSPEPRRKLAELEDATHIGHRQFHRAYEGTFETLRLKAIEIRNFVDAARASKGTP